MVNQPGSGERVAVVVLGELSRSPRMLNHARELAAAGFDTVAIGYAAGPLDLPGVSVRPLWAISRPGDGAPRFIFMVVSAFRMGLLLFTTFWALIRSRPTCVLVQNPPSFPTLAAAWLATRWSRARLIVDWHNYGYSMLALRLGSQHPLVRISEWYEGWTARKADRHFCVSEAMRADLLSRWGIRAQVLYDRPLQFEAPIYPLPATPAHGTFTLVSPSGWTADERMDVLLDALMLLGKLPIRAYLTGDGPQRSKYQTRIDAIRAAGLEIHAGFLIESEYRELIRRASVGISLHASSSGLDLAMKVVDFFAAGVPVCALDYGRAGSGALHEQIRPEENGYVFSTAQELAQIVAGLVAEPGKIEALRQNMRLQPGTTWTEEWNRVARPAIGNAGSPRA
jgi:beta-1,4-mannosyltransferase